ncbi:GNAT family N-acetyltransferase [Sphingomonas sp. NBWT7]|uniref:GNAT family N-acetyltransferase n=1 Tax=Sphingomonas sp. NBWT7 TaxID=2596913 RepID=UPI0016243551|nr:GNAT family N-acetyltransferase [Sphingomonas sp. NBWT7]QNE30780.1 GNAT family N-acetyltransferase [Sphingomonas sp. NBWT7]
MTHRIRRFRIADREAMLGFADALPDHDLLFLGRDLKHPRVIAAWLGAIAEEWIDSLVAEDDGAIIGSAALVRDPLGWSAHVGEIRLLVSAQRRGEGLGRDLLEAMLRIAAERGLAKLTAAMTPDQTGAIALFESLGFRGEALLKDQVRDRAGQPHDLVILSYDISRSAAQHRAYGFDS